MDEQDALQGYIKVLKAKLPDRTKVAQKPEQDAIDRFYEIGETLLWCPGTKVWVPFFSERLLVPLIEQAQKGHLTALMVRGYSC